MLYPLYAPYLCLWRESELHSPLAAARSFYASGAYPWLPEQGLLNS